MSRWIATLIVPLTLTAIGCAPHLTCDTGCFDTVVESECSTCGEYGCENHETIPYNGLQHLSHLGSSLIRGGGCGDPYLDEWVSEPPACDDRNFAGAHFPIHPFGGWRTLWGVRDHGGASDCTSCGVGTEAMIFEGHVIEGEPIEPGSLPEGIQPGPAPDETQPPQILPGPDARQQRSIMQPRNARRPTTSRWEAKSGQVTR